MKNFLNAFNKKQNLENSSSEDKEEFKESKSHQEGISSFDSSYALVALNNPFTFKKDIEVIKKYGQSFVNYLTVLTAKKLPIFTYPPSPVAVKEIILDQDQTLTAGQKFFFSFSPFAPKLFVYKGVNDTYTTTAVGDEVTKCFSHFQVVMAQVIIKQVGILSLSDGYGTIMDGVITSATQSDSNIKNSFLSLQVGCGKKVIGVDGRTGIIATLFGSPEYPKIFHDNMVEVNTSVPFGAAYIPANSVVLSPYSTNDYPLTIEYFDSTVSQVNSYGTLTLQKEAKSVLNTNAFVSLPQGEKIFVRVSPPASNVSIKIYLRIVVQGPLTPQYATDVPTFTPERPFDYNRVKLALENTIPAIVDSTHFSKITDCFSHEIFNYCLASDFPSKKELEEKFRRISEGGVASASDGIVIDRIAPAKIKTDKAKTVFLPDVLGKALKFSHQLVTKVKSTASSNRLFRDATTTLPASSYQYFPVVDKEGKEAVPSIVICNVGVLSCKKTKKYSVTSIEDKKTIISISYDETDFTEEGLKQFETALGVIVGYLWGSNYHSTIHTEFSIRFFSPAPLENTSYMLALTAALYGVPSGSYCTGSFSKKDSYYVPNPIGDLEVKVKSANIEYPLLVLSNEGPEGAGINVLSGVVPMFANGSMVPSFSLDMAMTYLATPFKIRKVNRTPYFQYNEDAQSFLLNNPIPLDRQYIAISNMNRDKLDSFITTKKFNIRDYVKSDPSNFVNYYAKKNRYVTTKSFFGKNPSLLNDANFWYFRVGDDIYVDNAAFINLVNETGEIKKGAPYMEDIGLNLEKTKKEDLANIGQEDVKAILEQKQAELERNVISYKIPVEQIYKEGDDNIPAADRIKELSKLVDGYVERLLDLQEYMTANGSTGKSSIAITGNNLLNNALSNLKIGNRVPKGSNLKEIPNLKFFEELANAIDVGGILTIALAGQWKDFQAKPKPASKDIKKVIAYVKKHPIVPKKMMIQEKEEIEEEINQPPKAEGIKLLIGNYPGKKKENKPQESPNLGKKVTTADINKIMSGEIGLDENED